jgi:hypothetical protein
MDDYLSRVSEAMRPVLQPYVDSGLLAKVLQTRDDLAQHGYAVVPSILSSDTCAELARAIWCALEQMTEGRVKSAHPDAALASTDFPWRMHGILLMPSEISHLAPVWEARTGPALDVFALLYGTDRLLGSYDRLNMYPSLPTSSKPSRERPWLHTDQTPLRKGFHCVQGYVDLYGTGPLDGGLVVCPGSHLAHHDYICNTLGERDVGADDWFRFSPEQIADIKQRFGWVKVQCPRGSLCLWDSRCFHQNEPPSPGGHARLVIYTCNMPLACIPQDKRTALLAKKQDAFSQQRATSHWPLKTKLFAATPQTYGKPLPRLKITPEIVQQPVPHRNHKVAVLAGFATEYGALHWPGHLPRLLPPSNSDELFLTKKQLQALLGFVSVPTKRARDADEGPQSKRPIKRARKE